jgi:hypothetical protein
MATLAAIKSIYSHSPVQTPAILESRGLSIVVHEDSVELTVDTEIRGRRVRIATDFFAVSAFVPLTDSVFTRLLTLETHRLVLLHLR